MRTLHIQVQPGRAKALDVVRLRREFHALATDNALVSAYRFSNGNDDGDYYNFDLDTPHPAALWDQIQAAIFEASSFGQQIRQSSMAICTGRNGWEDYLLIHHWDPDEDLDEVPAT